MQTRACSSGVRKDECSGTALLQRSGSQAYLSLYDVLGGPQDSAVPLQCSQLEQNCHAAKWCRAGLGECSSETSRQHDLHLLGACMGELVTVVKQDCMGALVTR